MIPPKIVAGLKTLALLDDTTFHKLTSAFQQLPPKMYRKDIWKGLKMVDLSLNENEVKDLTSAVFSLHLGQAAADVPKEEFLSNTLRGINKDLLNDGLAEQYVSVLEERLKELLAVESLSIGAKAQSIFFEHERNLSEAKILTDVRPIFGVKSTESPLAGIITHQLKLGYLEGGKVKDFYVSMDMKDIQKLAEVLERAKQKQKTLTDNLRSSIRFIESD